MVLEKRKLKDLAKIGVDFQSFSIIYSLLSIQNKDPCKSEKNRSSSFVLDLGPDNGNSIYIHMFKPFL